MLDPKALRDHVALASRGHLKHIVDDLLDVGRVHSGKILLDCQPLRLDLLVQASVTTLVQTGRTGSYDVSLDVEPAWVNADATRLEQIISNLLDNALKYTPSGGSIAVTVRCDGDDVALAVSDSGVGIAPELMPDIFELFVQGVRPLDRAQGGLGVGLALVRRLAELHGGSVEAHSAGTGKGSSFVLRLPRVNETDMQQVQSPPRTSSRQRILLIEDNEDGREMMAMMLESHDYTVDRAADGTEGLRMAAAQQPDIALVDIGLPGIDGYEVARRMRANPALAKVRLVALTGYGQQEDQRRAIEAGFDTHLVKPVELQHLMEVLESA
jgi:CheY-like chemotaxis protein/anti-sigma regulatory factor (Ser/Thr protein kinase)